MNKNTLLNAQQFSHYLLTNIINPGDIVIDATIGNGHDTLFLAQLVQEHGHVIGIDIQPQAVQNTKELLKQHNADTQCTLYDIGHENIQTIIQTENSVSAAIFNLGYLPKSDKSITTKGDTTIQAITQLLPLLRINGLIVVVIYDGHDGGAQERDALLSFVKALPQKQFSVLHYQFLNQANNPPHVIAIEKRQG